MFLVQKINFTSESLSWYCHPGAQVGQSAPHELSQEATACLCFVFNYLFLRILLRRFLSCGTGIFQLRHVPVCSLWTLSRAVSQEGRNPWPCTGSGESQPRAFREVPQSLRGCLSRVRPLCSGDRFSLQAGGRSHLRTSWGRRAPPAGVEESHV